MKNFFKKTTIPRSDLKSQKRSDLGMVKKIILLFVFIGIVFLGGGVGIINAAPSDTATGATAPTQQPATPNSSSQPSDPKTSEKGGNDALDLIQCANFLDKLTNPFGCFLPVTTYYLYVVTTGVLTLSGYLFDSLLGLSINREFIQKDFVNTIWTIMRDFSNMMFIFILIYTGIRTMLFMDDWKKPVMMVVVIALLINFSLFFTKIVIDAGNVLAMGVYSGIGVGEGTSVSAAFTNSFRPEQFFLFSASNKDIASTIFIIAGIISVYLAFVLFKAAFMFMGRILAFWFLMVISPFAFILLAFPQLGAKIKFRFDAWLDMLINQAFVAPVFLFFIYIIMKVIQAKVFEVGLSKPSGAGVLVDSLFMPIVMMGMIIYALKKALSVAESMSGDFGKIGANLGNKVLGLAAGGAGMALTGGVGGLANKVFQSGVMQRMAEGRGGEGIIGKFAGRQGVLLADKTRNTSFDARNIKLGGIGKGIGAGEGNKDGFMKREEKWMKEQDRKAKLMEMTSTEKAEVGFKSKEEMGKMEKTESEAKKSVKEAKTKANNSESGKKVTEASNKKSGASMAGDAAIKKLEAEKERQKAAITDEQRAVADTAVAEAEKAAKEATQTLANTESELILAQNEHKVSKEVKALREAEETLEQVTETIKRGKEANRAVEEGNLHRRETYGKAVTWTRPTSWWNRQKQITKIREGPPEEEKAEEDMSKWWKKMSEKEKESREKPAVSEKPKVEEPPETK